MSEDHERRIQSLEADRSTLYSKVNDLCTRVAVLISQWENRPGLPCAEHKERMDKLEAQIEANREAAAARLAKLESTGSRFVGMWDLAKVGLGALIPVGIFVIQEILSNQ